MKGWDVRRETDLFCLSIFTCIAFHLAIRNESKQCFKCGSTVVRLLKHYWSCFYSAKPAINIGIMDIICDPIF